MLFEVDLLINSMPYIYAHTMANPLSSSGLFSSKLPGLLDTPICNFCYSYFPQGITILQIYFFLVTIQCGNIPHLNLNMTFTLNPLVLAA